MLVDAVEAVSKAIICNRCQQQFSSTGILLPRQPPLTLRQAAVPGPTAASTAATPARGRSGGRLTGCQRGRMQSGVVATLGPQSAAEAPLQTRMGTTECELRPGGSLPGTGRKAAGMVTEGLSAEGTAGLLPPKHLHRFLHDHI